MFQISSRIGSRRSTKVLRSSGLIGNGGAGGINSQLVIQGGKDFLIVYRAILWNFTEPICGADHLAGFHTATGEQAAGNLWPVVASGAGVDAWHAAKFAPRHHADVLIQTTLVKIFHERCDALIEPRQLDGTAFEIATMPVPAAEGKSDTADTSFNQPARHQKRIHPVRTCGGTAGSAGQWSRETTAPGEG